MKFKVFLFFLIIFVSNNVLAMESTKKSPLHNFLYKHPWISSLAIHTGSIGVSLCSKRFHCFISGIPLTIAIPGIAIFCKRFGHNNLVKSETPHRMKRFHSLCTSKCKGQFEHYQEYQEAIRENHTQINELRNNAQKIRQDYKNRSKVY